MNDETKTQDPMAPFLYAVVYPSGEIYCTHKSKKIATWLAALEREYVAGCTTIPLYAVPKSLSESVSKMDAEVENMSARDIFLGMSSAALKRENALEQKLAESQRELRAADATIENLQMQLEKLAEENAGLKAVCEDRRTFIMNGVQLGFIQVPTVETDPALETIRIAVSPQEPTPATDAFLAELLAQGVDSAINTVIAMMNHQHPVISKAIDILRVHAYQLRKGVQS